jgi:drug/metabolite transporter (DMT)-like permease|tara:strand:- start:4783 stop:5742 length:960 start_codon:yes stop_codon:yes gene_type:complete
MLLRANVMLLLTAFIWGFGFVAQDEAMKYLDPYSFNAFRFLLGALSLLPLVCFFGTSKAKLFNAGKPFWVIGGLAGIALLLGATLQQMGIDVLGKNENEATEGKAGFITGLYLVIVPLIGFCLRQKIDKLTVGGVLLATFGLYLLSIKEDLTIGEGDSLVLIGAFFWAVHVQVVGYAAKYKLDPLKLAVVQYLICAGLSFGLYLFNYRVLEIEGDKLSLQSTLDASGAILFAGFVSVGVAYTLQIFAQKHVAPSRAAILLSLEAVFAVLAGWLWDDKLLNSRESSGCILMFAGMLLSQFPIRKKNKEDSLKSRDSRLVS